MMMVMMVMMMMTMMMGRGDVQRRGRGELMSQQRMSRCLNPLTMHRTSVNHLFSVYPHSFRRKSSKRRSLDLPRRELRSEIKLDVSDFSLVPRPIHYDNDGDVDDDDDK